MKTRWQSHYRQNLRLSVPIVFSQLSTVLIMTSDALMVGNHDSTELAAAAFGNNIFALHLIPGFGMASALKPLIANAYAAHRLQECRILLRHGLLTLLLYSLMVTLLWPVFRQSLGWFGQPEEVIRLAAPFVLLTILSLVPFLLFIGLVQFMESLSETKLPMYINLGGALLNVALNYLLIFGKGGFPELGLLGAGWASLITRLMLLLTAVFFFYRRRQFRAFLPENWRVWEAQLFYRILNLGIPLGLQRLFEFSAFMVAALMVGWLGAVPLAAHQIGLTLSTITFMAAMGLAEGNTIYVAQQAGRGAWQQVRPAGNSAFVIVAVFMGTAALLFLVFREQIPLLFLSAEDPNLQEVQSTAAVLLLWAAAYQVADGLQVVAMGALRGLEDVRIPTLIALLAYWVLGIPVGYLLGFVVGWGAGGIWIGLVVGLSVAAVLLLLRFRWLSRPQLRTTREPFSSFKT